MTLSRSPRFVAFLLTALLSGCGSTPTDPSDGGGVDAGSADAGYPACTSFTALRPCGECRSDDDCVSGEDGVFPECYAPGQRAPGGAPIGDPERLCEDNEECAGDTVCTPYRNEFGLTNTACRAPCSADSCEGEDDRCGSEGLCEPIPCDEGFVCPEHTACDPDAAGHGCVRDSCSSDADCDSGGFCVLERCYSSIGTCQVRGA
ncbi:MAG: hypothetical protein AB8I08_09990 [Sandaracinaceae bacterium]